MNPLWKSDAAPTPWSPAAAYSIGYPQGGDLITGTHPTRPGGDWFEAMATEIKAVIEGAGLTFDPTDTSQFLKAIRVLVAPPVPVTAKLTASPLSGIAPLAVAFTDKSTGTPLSWSWDFGDGASSTVQNPSHTYTGAGTYSVTLQVTDSAGVAHSVTLSNLISVVPFGSDAYRTYVPLLLHGDGVDGSTTFTDSSRIPKAPTIHGTPTISTAQSVFGGASIHIPASSNGLVYAGSTGWGSFGTDPFTIECRVLTTAGSGYAVIASAWTASNTAWLFGVDSSGALCFFRNGTFTALAGHVSDGAWHSVAVSRSATTLWLYVDGAVVGTFSISASEAINTSTALVAVGMQADSSGTTRELYIEELRITRHVDRLGGVAYTPASIAFPNIGPPQVLLHFDGSDGARTFTDSAPAGSVWTPATATTHLSTAAAVFGTAALVGGTDGDGITTPWPAGLDLSGPFTIAARWKCPAGFSGSGTYRFLSSMTGSSGDHILTTFVDGGVLQWYQGVYGTSDGRIQFNDFPPFVAGNTYAIAFSRDSSNVIRCAVNGVVSTVSAVDATDYTKASTTLCVGVLDKAGPNSAFGAIDELMVSTDCLFTANYTVQTAQFDATGIVHF